MEGKAEGMAWTRRAPAEPGWWWILEEAQLGRAEPRPAKVYMDRRGRLAVCGHSLEWLRASGMELYWAGPIAEPPDLMASGVAEDAE
ncbi:MAG: hypothetical protein K6E40_02385 [Desulfovibrio sp.]|nr:hypothetical protein [Desulfovibrio sp.]